MVADQRVTHSQIDFSIVKEIFEASGGGQNFGPFMSEKYPFLERQVAILGVQEQQLLIISNKFRLEYELQKGVAKKKMSQKLAIEMLDEAYRELDTDSKYELMPLFFSTDMNSEESIYLPTAEVRDLAFKAFLSLIKKDKLDLEALKREYSEYQDLAYLLPLQDHIKEGKTASRATNKTQNDGSIFKWIIWIGVVLAAAYFLMG